VLIGAQAKFKVTFKNAGAVGYGPFLDLVLDAGGAGVKKTGCACDGITFVSAKMVGVNGGPFALTPASPTPTLTAPCGNAPATVPHPFASSGVQPLTLPAGAQLVTLTLPFGSFDPTQPAIEVEVTVNVSNLADVGIPLQVWARGGFRYGTDPLDNPSLPDPPILTDENPPGTQVANVTLWGAQGQMTPGVLIVNKTYLGPEGENATGPNFIGYYPLKYRLTIEVAPGQTLSNVVLTDCLPDNMAFHQIVSITNGGTPGNLPPVDVPASPNCLTVNWATLNGSASVVFEFFIPENDASGNTVLPPNCKPAASKDELRVTAFWTPLDACDGGLQPVGDGPVYDTLSDKCIAIQKSVALSNDTGAQGFTPGDTLKYTLDFQISDYKTIGAIDITDMLSDGQQLVALTPTLTVKDRFGTTSGAFVTSSDLLVAPYTNNVGGVNGGTQLTFLISQKMINIAPPIPRHAAGILTGGYAAGSSSTVPATGRIVFYAQITDTFANQQPGDKFVDKEDPIKNSVRIGGKVLTNVIPPAMPTSTGLDAFDDSGTAVSIVGDRLEKTVYMVQRRNALGVFKPACGPGSSGPCSNAPGVPQEVLPGDLVTYELKKTIPSSDAEKLTVEDWLPRPTYNVTGTTFVNSTCGTLNAGQACLGPSNSLNVPPNVTVNAATNGIKFDYGTFDDPTNTPKTIDLLITEAVTNLPFADGLFLTNEAQECESNTFGKFFCQVAVAQVNVRQPNLRIRKAVVYSSNTNAVFTPAPPAPLGPVPPAAVFNQTGFAGGIVNSANVGLINSNVSNVDANDIVTFAITIENAGGAPAYDVKVRDIIPTDTLGNPSCFTIVPNTIQVKRGTGALVAPALYSINSTAAGFTITSNPTLPIPLSAYNQNSGANVVVVTFQAKMRADIKPGCCDNVARLERYSSTLGGPDFVAANVNAPFDDAAQVCVKPTLTKSLVATSEPHTAPQVSTTPQNASNTPQVAIGEIVRYRLLTIVPEGGVLTNLQVTDALPAGMKFMGAGTTRIAFIANQGGLIRSGPLSSPLFSATGNAPLSSAVLKLKPPFTNALVTGGAGCGSPVIFNLGNVQNTDNDNDLEYVEIEFDALVCNAASNQDGVALGNTFTASAGGALLAASNSINVNIVEPDLKLTKTASPSTVVSGGTLSYAVTVTNTGTTQAFDVKFTDTLPTGLALVPASVAVVGSCLPSPGINQAVPSVTCLSVPQGGAFTVKYQAVATAPSCPATLTNKAAVTWTSLPASGTPVGANNPTLSSTPGASGANDGERNGTTAPLALNDYAATASAPLNVKCPPCATPPQKMVAWWPFDEPNGAATLKDIAGFNNAGTPKPSSPLGSAGAPVAVAGKVGGALSFNPNFQQNGPNVEVPDHPEINFGTNDFSIDAWVYVPTPPAVYIHPIVDKLSINAAGTQGSGYALSLVGSFSSGARLQFVMGTGSTLVGYLGPNAPSVPFNTWTHVTVTVGRSTGAVTFYVNGAPLTTTPATMPAGSVTNNVPLLIGESRTPGVHQAAITLDELEMFSKLLTQGEIQSIVNAGPAGKCRCVLTTVEKLSCNANGTFTYIFILTNNSGATVSTVNLSTASNVNVTPSTLSIPPLAPGASTAISVTISGPGAVPGANVCLSVGLAGPASPGCRAEHCIKLPACNLSRAPDRR
jgi:uncharacterized repeat protein (TIGR01451 family)